jgi:hypothetical protein
MSIKRKATTMHIARFTRPLAVAGISAVTILACVAASGPPRATAASSSALYTTPLIVSTTGTGNSSLLYGPNWAGYVATGSISTASFVIARTVFTVPSVNCTKTPNGYVSHWAGLDGLGYNAGSSSSVEAAGVTAECVSGAASYNAWWETYPDPQTSVFSVNGGDTVAVQVVYNNTTITGGADKYNFIVDDQTTGQSADLLESCAAAACRNSSAEVVTSIPSDAAGVSQSNIQTLADYATANFEQIGVTNSANQTGGFSSTSWVDHEALLVNPSTLAALAGTGTLYGGEAFFTSYAPPGVISP